MGNHQRVNNAGAPNTYYWAAFGPHVPQVRYRSIGTAADLTNQGTITVTAGSTSVTKVGGTGWRTANRGRGDRLSVGTDHYLIASVDSDTALTLTAPAVTSYTGSTYTIARLFDDAPELGGLRLALGRQHLQAPRRHAGVLPDGELEPRGRRPQRGGDRVQGQRLHCRRRT